MHLRTLAFARDGSHAGVWRNGGQAGWDQKYISVFLQLAISVLFSFLFVGNFTHTDQRALLASRAVGLV